MFKECILCAGISLTTVHHTCIIRGHNDPYKCYRLDNTFSLTNKQSNLTNLSFSMSKGPYLCLCACREKVFKFPSVFFLLGMCDLLWFENLSPRPNKKLLYEIIYFYIDNAALQSLE